HRGIPWRHHQRSQHGCRHRFHHPHSPDCNPDGTMTGSNPVCVVDDDEAVRDSLTLLLECSGFAVKAFDSAAAFLAGRPAAVACLLLDMHMPDISGLELLQRLK